MEKTSRSNLKFAQTGWWFKLENLGILIYHPASHNMEASRKLLMCSAPLLARRGDLMD
jgi:hypothetical protein